MDSSATNPLPPPAIRDCSQGICSLYCPQWCYIVYPPPPPSIPLSDDNPAGVSSFQFSPLVVAVIGILVSTFILVTYYSIVSRFCRRATTATANPTDAFSQTDRDDDDDAAQISSGLDESLIKSITVRKYQRGLLVEGSDCSVCLSEFQENESLRLLPKCNHAFHLPCIDPWLKSHSSCPLCRFNISPAVAPPTEAPPSSVTANAASSEQNANDVVVVIQSSDQSSAEQQQQEVAVSLGAANDVVVPKLPVVEDATHQVRVSVADILSETDDGDVQLQNVMRSDIGSSTAIEGGKN